MPKALLRLAAIKTIAKNAGEPGNKAETLRHLQIFTKANGNGHGHVNTPSNGNGNGSHHANGTYRGQAVDLVSSGKIGDEPEAEFERF